MAEPAFQPSTPAVPAGSAARQQTSASDARRRPAPAVIAAICPFLVASDGAWRSASPSRDHRCGAVDPPGRLTTERQESLCLVAAHLDCDLFEVAAGLSTGSGGSSRDAETDTDTRRPMPRTMPIVLDRGGPSLDLRLPRLALPAIPWLRRSGTAAAAPAPRPVPLTATSAVAAGAVLAGASAMSTGGSAERRPSRLEELRAARMRARGEYPAGGAPASDLGRLRSPARSRQGPLRGRRQAHEAPILPAAAPRPRIRMTKVKRPARQPAIRRPRAPARLLARHRGPPALEPRARRVRPPISTRVCARASPAARSRSPSRASWVLPSSWCSWRDPVHRADRPGRWPERRHQPRPSASAAARPSAVAGASGQAARTPRPSAGSAAASPAAGGTSSGGSATSGGTSGGTAGTPNASATPTAAAAGATAAPTKAPTATRTYRVKSGDTLSAIAARFGTTAAVLMRLNNIKDARTLRVGQALKLP